MRIMTFNLRFDNDQDGENGWKHRRNLVIEIIQRSSPTILGTQEGTPAQLEYLCQKLPLFGMVSGNRPDDPTCQYPTIFYLKEVLGVRDFGEFWLSLNPQVHRSKAWDSAFPRMMSYGRFEELESRREFWAAVTHLDHLGTYARLEQSRIIAGWMQKRKGARILMGDFNDKPDSPSHRLLTSESVGLKDTWELLRREEGPDSMTHHGFLGIPQKCRMDWILSSSEFRVRDAVIVKEQKGGRYPSDHFPYSVELLWG